MKINKKTIIILIVVAVAAYLLWRRYKENSEEDSSSGDTAPAGVDLNSVDSILTAIGATSTEKTKIKKIEQQIADSLTWQANVSQKAEETGRTYAQQVVCTGYWQLYHDNTTDTWTNPRGWQQTKKVDSL